MPIPLAGLALGLGAPALSYMHGKSKGKNDPSKGGLFGTLATGALLNPLSGIAYGMGHRAGRDAAVDQAMDDVFGKPVKLRQQDLKRDERGKALLDLLDGGGSGQMMNQYGQPFNPLGGLNQQIMGGGFNPFQKYMY
jgi:hypothetical protein